MINNVVFYIHSNCRIVKLPFEMPTKNFILPPKNGKGP